jgi:N-acetylmuramoyl-L-alanine amidase
MKRKWLIFVILCGLLFSTSAHRPLATHASFAGIRKVVIDAGHGGNDPGAVGKKYRESQVALSIALKLGALIKESFPDIEVIYTRKTDVFVELYNRAKIANTAKANLFISIHCNASKATTASGTETWVMGLHKSEANLEVARQENATILMEDDYENQYDGFDPNSPEANIIFSLFQNIYLDQSLQLAAGIQSQFERKLGRVNRGVKQAGFLVLYKTTMPGVLIETGFISNPEEEEFLGSENGQNQIAAGIFRAFKDYKSDIEDGLTADDSDDVIVPPVKDTTSKKTNNTNTTVQQLPAKDTVKKADEIWFRVQFATYTSRKSVNSPEFASLSDVRYYVQNNIYKYTCGNFATMEEAVKLQKEVQQKGFKDAFVVAFLNEKRIAPTDAVQLLKNKNK